MNPLIQDEEDEDEQSLTEDQGHLANDDVTPPAEPENADSSSSSAESPKRNLKDADVQTMIDQVMEQAREAHHTEDEIQLLKLKLEEVKFFQ